MFRLLNLYEYELSRKQEIIEMMFYSLTAFLIPMLLSHPQYLVGTVVNFLLIISAMNIKGYKLLPVIVTPSLGALIHGALFGPFTVFLIYMIPFIWIGNIILVYSFKYFKLNKKINYWTVLLIGSVLKAGFLFLMAYILYYLNLVPALFLTVMSTIQLITVISGGIIAFWANKIHIFINT